MFVSKAKAYPFEAPLRLSLPTFRLGLEGLPGLNTVAYSENLYITGVKYYKINTRANVIKHFMAAIY
jgi:hypothetical protein